MNKYLIKKGIFAALYLICAVVIEMSTFIQMKYGLLPTYFIFDFILMLFVAVVIFVIPNNIASIIVAGFMLAAQAGVSAFNINLFFLYGDIFSMDLLDFAKEATAVNGGSFFNYYVVILYQLYPLGAIVLMIVTQLFIRDKFEFKRRNALMLGIVMLCNVIFVPATYIISQEFLIVDTESQYLIRRDDRDLFENITYKNGFFYRFGTFPLYFRNVVLGQPVGKSNVYANTEELVEYLEFGKQNRVTDGEYFGLDAGNNVIVLMLESCDTFLIHPKYTPTLYSLMSGGMRFDNYHSQNKTDYSEATVILGSYPSRQNIVSPFFGPEDWQQNTFNNNINSQFDYSLPNMLKSVGVEKARYFHPNFGDYYSRKYTHTQYGFDEAYFLEDYPTNPKFADYESYVNDEWSMPERYFFDSAIDQLLPTGERFFSFVTTINAHGSYVDSYGEYVKQFYNAIDDGDFSTVAKSIYPLYKNALSEAMVLDDGIKYLVEQMKARGLYDNTTMLLYADHNAYINDLAYVLKNSSSTMSTAFNVPAALVSPSAELQNKRIDKFVNTFDFTVLLMELLGVSYNPHMYLGNSLASDTQTVVISKIGGIFNHDFYTFDGVEILYRREGSTDEQFIAFQQAFYDLSQKWYYIDAMFLDKSDTLVLKDFI